VQLFTFLTFTVSVTVPPAPETDLGDAVNETIVGFGAEASVAEAGSAPARKPATAKIVTASRIVTGQIVGGYPYLPKVAPLLTADLPRRPGSHWVSKIVKVGVSAS
jgi:hypothetical protein